MSTPADAPPAAFPIPADDPAPERLAEQPVGVGEGQHSEDRHVEGEHGKAPSVDGPPSTGDVAVDEALSELPDLLHQPLEAQVDGYTAVHGRLQDRLADLDG
jgi:hypothetical protein